MKPRPLSPCHLVILSVFALALPALAADAPPPPATTTTAPALTTAPAPAPMPTFTPRESRSSRYSRSSRSSSRDSSTPRSSGDETDDILLRKSIFAKDRRTAYNRDSAPRETTPVSTRPPAIPVLIGVMREDNGFVAYIQDPDTGTIWPFAPGDPLPGDAGTVQDLTLDYMDVARSGPDNPSPLRIQIGQNLAGKSSDYSVAPAAPAPAADSVGSASTAPAGTASTSTTTPAAAPADTSGLSLEERMKLRAKQQRGQ